MMRAIAHREKASLGAVLAVTLAAGLWSLIWQPALQSKQESLATLSKVDGLAAALQTLPKTLVITTNQPTEPLQQRVTTTARAAGVEIMRLDPQGEALSVSLNDVSFAVLIQWVETMTTAHGVRVLAAEIGRRPTPGHVSVRLVLEVS